jgi:hypothetical protein
MPRITHNPREHSQTVSVYGIQSGGTGQSHQATALDALDGVPSSQIGTPSGLVPLDENNKIPETYIDKDKFPVGNIVGPETAVVNQTMEYTITNYDSFTEYVVSAQRGTVTRISDKLIYKAPTSGGPDTLIINDRQIGLSVDTVRPLRPSLAANTFGTVDSSVSMIIQTGAFAMNAPSMAVHSSTDFQVATDVNFQNIAASQTINSYVSPESNRTSALITGLVKNTTYFVRVRHRDSSNNVSEWGNISVQTLSSYVPNTNTGKLMPLAAINSDMIGKYIALSEDGTTMATVTLGGDENLPTSDNAVYVYSRNGVNWSTPTKLKVPNRTITEEGSTFTVEHRISSVASIGMNPTGEWIAVVVAAGQDTEIFAEYIAIFNKQSGSWSFHSMFEPLGGNSSIPTYFAFDKDGQRLMVSQVIEGGAYVYTMYRDGEVWVQEAILQHQPTDANVDQYGSSIDGFGESISLSDNGDVAVVGAYSHTVDGSSNQRQGAFYVYRRNGNIWNRQGPFLASDPQTDARFGYSVCCDDLGNRIVVGSPRRQNTAVNAGAVYVFTYNGTTYSQTAKILPSDPVVNDYFGTSVAITRSSPEPRLAIGVPNKLAPNGTSRGMVYLYALRGTWVFETRFTSPDAGNSDQFGTSVAVSDIGDIVVAGAPQHRNSTTNQITGAIYAFTY